MKKINAYNFRCTCRACPTQFEFKDENNRKYYFRLRWYGWYLADITNEEDWKYLISGECKQFGSIDKENFLKLMKKNGYDIQIQKNKKKENRINA